jgi:hypothetical protein
MSMMTQRMRPTIKLIMLTNSEFRINTGNNNKKLKIKKSKSKSNNRMIKKSTNDKKRK